MVGAQKKIRERLKRHGYNVWINNNGVKGKQGLEANVDLLAVKNEYTFLIQIKSDKEAPNHGVRGLQEVAGHSDFIIPTYVYPEKKEAINLRTRLPVLKDIWNKDKEK